jgi:hypothetical protein
MTKLPEFLTVSGLAILLVAASTLGTACALKPVSISEEVIAVSKPAANDDAVNPEPEMPPANVTTTVATAPEQDAEPEAVSFEPEGAALNPAISQEVAVIQAFEAPPPQGRYVLASRPIFGRFGRTVGYQQVWVWQWYQAPRQYQYQRPVYRYYEGGCPGGVCR